MATEYGPIGLLFGVVIALRVMNLLLRAFGASRAAGPAPAQGTPPDPRLFKTSTQLRRDLHARIDEALHRSDRLLEHRLLGIVEADLDDLLDAVCTDHHGHADVHVL